MDLRQEIPKFIKIRGCINCDISKLNKLEHGTDYGFNHELMFSCIGCMMYGVSLMNPYIDPEELLRWYTEQDDKSIVNITRCKEYCQKLNQLFGQYYDDIGIDIDRIISDFVKEED